MMPRLLLLHPSTYQRLVRLSKEAERDGAYRVAKRLRAVVLNSEGHTSGALAEILQAPRSKVSEWLQRYQTAGVDGLLEGYRSGRPSEMTEKQQQQLGDILDSGPVAYGLDTGIWTSPMIAWVIEQEFGVQYQLPRTTRPAVPPPGSDSDSGQRLLPQGRRGLGLVQIQPALAGSTSIAALLAGIEPYRTAVAAHPQERHTQSLLRRPGPPARHSNPCLWGDAVPP